MSYTFTTSGAILLKAGANVSTNFTGTNAQANLSGFSDNAEALINAVARIDLVASYSTLGTNTKAILGDVASDLAAMRAISYDSSGYTNSSEVQTMLNVLFNNSNRGLKLLENKNTTDFLE